MHASASPPALASRLACADSAFPKLSHAGALQVISDLRVGAVDICVFAGYDHNPPETVVANPKAAADRVRRGLEETGLVVADVFAILATSFDALAVNHPDKSVRAESRAQFERVLEFARCLDAPGVTVLPGVEFDGVDPVESRRLAATELQHRAKAAHAVGLRLAIEPHYQSIVDTPEKTTELLRRAPYVTLSLDLSHFVYQGISQADVRVLLPRTRHVHLRQAAPGVMQAPVGEGTIDFLALRDELASCGYSGYLTLEYQHEEWLDCHRVDCISETAALRDLILS